MTLATQYPYLSSEDWKRIEQRLLEEVIGADDAQPTRPLVALDGTAWEEYETIKHRNELRAEQRQALHLLIGGEV